MQPQLARQDANPLVYASMTRRFLAYLADLGAFVPFAFIVMMALARDEPRWTCEVLQRVP
jgi:hypothetical protein